MTTKNNFTRAPEGIPSISATACYDYDQSRWQFQEAFKILHSGNRGATIAYYIDSGNVPDDSEIEFTVKGDNSEKVLFLKKEGYEDETMPSESEYDDYIIDSYNERLTLLNYEDFNQYMFKDFNLEIVPSKNLIKVSIHGYSQGDYAEVFYCPDDLEKAWGTEPKESDLRDTFTNLFYDAPIYASVTIDGEEYVYHECPDFNEYEWNRAEFLAWVAKESGVSIELIDDILPKEPSY